jgi:hypothetical protein
MSKNNLSPARREAKKRKMLLQRKGWLKGTGTLVYDPKRNNKNNTEQWLVLEVDREITRYFRWWVDRELMNITGVDGMGILQPSGDAHVSVLRGKNDLKKVPAAHREALWNKYAGRRVDFLYNPNVQLAKGEFWFVEVDAPWLTDIRKIEFDIPYDFGLHLTIGRMRESWLGHVDNRLKLKTWNGRRND